MRSAVTIERDIVTIKQAIREARADGNERELELFYQDLEELQEELHNAKTTTIS